MYAKDVLFYMQTAHHEAEDLIHEVDIISLYIV